MGVMGPSGCGKSTLLRAVSGLVDSSSGAILLHGKPPETWDWPRFRRKVLLATQRPTLFPGAVAQNLARPFSYASAEGAFNAARAKMLLERLGIEKDCFERDALSLSVGQQQRVCLVRALLLEPEVLLLDEPTSALDEESEAAVEQAIREETETRGMGALIVSHDPAQVARWCGRSLQLEGIQGGARHD